MTKTVMTSVMQSIHAVQTEKTPNFPFQMLKNKLFLTCKK